MQLFYVFIGITVIISVLILVIRMKESKNSLLSPSQRQVLAEIYQKAGASPSVANLLAQDQRIAAIKQYRTETNTTLPDSITAINKFLNS